MTISLYGGKELILKHVISEHVLTLDESAFFNKETNKDDFSSSKEVQSLT